MLWLKIVGVQFYGRRLENVDVVYTISLSDLHLAVLKLSAIGDRSQPVR
jgi:hypothetical protein